MDVVLLRQAIAEHLEKHKSLYGNVHVVPKHHFAIHLPEQVARDGVLTDCFVVERSHLLPRSVANNIDNTMVFNKCAIQRMLLVRMASLEPTLRFAQNWLQPSVPML